MTPREATTLTGEACDLILKWPDPYQFMTNTEKLRNQFMNIIRAEAQDNGATYEEAVGALEVVKEIMLREAVNEYHQKVKVG